MFYVDRGEAPDALAQIKKEELPKWQKHFSGLMGKPGGRWTEDSIRGPLVYAFQENCGYCGIHANVAKKGEVDHYVPKHIDKKRQKLELTYSWTNYVWSCHACNSRKHTFFSEKTHIMDPCSQEDMSSLVPDDSGGYQLGETYRTNPTWEKRFQNTHEWTLINDKDLKHDRKVQRTRIEESLAHMASLESLAHMFPTYEDELAKERAKLQDLTKTNYKLLTRWCLQEQAVKTVRLADLGMR